MDKPKRYHVWQEGPIGLHYLRDTWAVSEEQAINQVRWTTYGRVAVGDLPWPLVASISIGPPPYFRPIVSKKKSRKNNQLFFQDFLQPKSVF